MEDLEKRKDTLVSYARTKEGADVYFREEWECDYFSLHGKCFGMMGVDLITLKGNPEDNLKLRETHQDVIPGYYANKKHWNSIKLNTEELTTKEILHLIDISYTLVFKKLTRKEQLAIFK